MLGDDWVVCGKRRFASGAMSTRRCEFGGGRQEGKLGNGQCESSTIAEKVRGMCDERLVVSEWPRYALMDVRASALQGS